MKTLFIITLLFLGNNCIGQKKDSVVIKTYYYMWTANHGTSTAWGEYSLELSKKPTEKEVKSRVINMLGKNDWAVKYLIIEMILEFETSEDYYKWHSGFQPSTLAREIYIYRKH